SGTSRYSTSQANRPPHASTFLLPARLDLQATAEEPGRSVEEDHDEDAEREPVLPRGDEIRDAHGLDHAEDERGHHGADDVAGSADPHSPQAPEPQARYH